MLAPQERQRPRSTTHESSGTFSYHASSCPHDMQAEPGLTIERFSGTRAATTLRNEPIASPGASAMAASVIRSARRLRRGRGVRRRVLRLARLPVLLVPLERHRDERRARVGELRAGGRRLADADVRGIAGDAALHRPGEAGVLELLLREDERLVPQVRHDERQRHRGEAGLARRDDGGRASGREADRSHGQGTEDGGDEEKPTHAVLFGRSQPRLKRTTEGCVCACVTTSKTGPEGAAEGAAETAGTVSNAGAATTAGVRSGLASAESSCQAKAVPAKLWNHASSCGQAVGG